MDARPIGCFWEPDVTRLAAMHVPRTLPGWQQWILPPSDASRNRTLPGWQRWMLASSGASGNRTLRGWQRWMFAPSDASRNPQSCIWQPWKLPDSRFSYTPDPPTCSESAMRDASSVFSPSSTRHLSSDPCRAGLESWGRCWVFAPLRVLRAPKKLTSHLHSSRGRQREHLLEVTVGEQLARGVEATLTTLVPTKEELVYMAQTCFLTGQIWKTGRATKRN